MTSENIGRASQSMSSEYGKCRVQSSTSVRHFFICHRLAAVTWPTHVYTSKIRYQHSLKPRNKRISAKKSVHVAFQCRFRAKNRQIRRGMGQKTAIFSFNGKIWA